MSTRVLRLPDVVKRTGLPRSTIYARISSLDFPKSIPLGGRTVGWIEADVEAWITSKREIVRIGDRS